MAKEIIEKGDLYFFYRPKVHEEQVRSLDDVERFYIVTAAESGVFRYLVVGQKYMPEIYEGRMAPAERNWVIVDYVTRDAKDLAKAKLGWAETAANRRVNPPRPVGAAKYQLILHEDHTELAYSLEAPETPGDPQKVFNIFPEAAYIFKVKNPQSSEEGYPGAEQKPDYPEELKRMFDEDWINLKDPRLINYGNAQILLIGARKSNIERELGIEFHKESADKAIDKLYDTLQIGRKDHPAKPIKQGEWPESKKAA